MSSLLLGLTAVPFSAILLFNILFFVAALLLHALTPRAHDKDGNPVPTGPIGLPIVGSFFSLTSYPELTLHRWAEKFGPLYSLWLGDTRFFIISDPRIAKDLMITNGAIFSSRKQMFVKFQTIFVSRGITAAPYEEASSHCYELYEPIRRAEIFARVRLYTKCYAGQLPVDPQLHAGRCSLNNMLTIVFGTWTDSVDDGLAAHALKLSREFMNCTGPMSNLVDFVPVLQKLPGGMYSRGKKLHSDLVDTYGGMLNKIRQRMARGEDVPDCLAKNLILGQEAEKLEDLDINIPASAFMIGGVETTASIMQWLCAIIPAYLEIQAKAHEELDRVVGRDRLPTTEDEKDLPYVHAVVKEISRCRNPFWLGTPHLSTEDFTYEGKFIPKNSVLVLNTYSMHHDPTC